MYEENRTGFILKDILLQVFLVIIFVFILVWLFPTKSYVDKKIDSSLDPIYQEFFNEHLESMKEAAQSYFTTSRLPKKVGDKVTLTLGDMLDKKLITSFVDSNQKQCSLTGSYVEVTKMDDEFTMKVNLSCSDKSDYILVNMGCYDYCGTGLCEKQETTKPTTTKPTTNNNTNNNNTNNNNNSGTVKPTVNEKQYKYVLYSTGGYSNWSSWSKWSTKKVTETTLRDVDTDERWEVVDTEKVKNGYTYDYVDADIINTLKVKEDVVCPTGYRRYNSTSRICVADPIKTTGTTSTKTEYVDSIKTTTKVCPDGRVTTNDWCFAKDTKSATSSVTYGAWSKPVQKEYTSPQTTTETTKYEYVTQKQELDCTNNCKVVIKYVYNVSTRTGTTNYSCPSGYTLSGTSCTKTISVYGTWTEKTTETCENGTTPVNGKCAVTKTTSSTTSKISCPLDKAYDASTGYCYTLGTKVEKCPYGANGEVVNGKCVVYGCDEGTLSGKQCKIKEINYKTKNIYGYVTYYRYRTRSYTAKEILDIEYSKYNNDKTLLNKGYEYAGEA